MVEGRFGGFEVAGGAEAAGGIRIGERGEHGDGSSAVGNLGRLAGLDLADELAGVLTELA